MPDWVVYPYDADALLHPAATGKTFDTDGALAEARRFLEGEALRVEIVRVADPAAE